MWRLRRARARCGAADIAGDRAAADGMVRMDLTTARTNRKAQSLYASLGWEIDDVLLAYNRRVVS